jgi:hypothetical protein
MLEAYPWYMVHGCYGTLLEAYICDDGTYLRHIFGTWFDVMAYA